MNNSVKQAALIKIWRDTRDSPMVGDCYTRLSHPLMMPTHTALD